MKAFDSKKIFKSIFPGILLVICFISTWYFHFILKIEIVFTHLFYMPVIISAFLWSGKVMAVPVFLALMLLISHAKSPLETPSMSDIIRACMFVIVGIVIAVLNQKILKLTDELRSYEYL